MFGRYKGRPLRWYLQVPVFAYRRCRSKLDPEWEIYHRAAFAQPRVSVVRAARAGDVPCKCCPDGPAGAFAVVPASKNCARLPAPEFGPPVAYYRCRVCGFLFTIDFDRWTPADFQSRIYNDDYHLFDGDYAEARPRQMAQLVDGILEGRHDLRILDYGGGSGRLAGFLRERGYKVVDSYDPFEPEFARRPAAGYDVALCFEVLEHVPDPVATLADIRSLLNSDGLLIATTLYQPQEISRLGADWWYLAPRNGHISLFTSQALGQAAQRAGLSLCDRDGSVHLFRIGSPQWANRVVSRSTSPRLCTRKLGNALFVIRRTIRLRR
jgi:2-polyprenyl-6-hydroxyphenyl methylase/3-demethylubiquinone-9 3-methyltransferase